MSPIPLYGCLFYLFLPIQITQPYAVVAIIPIPHLIWKIYSTYNLLLLNPLETGFWWGQTDVNNYNLFGGVAYPQLLSLELFFFF